MLHENHEVLLVVTQPDKEVGRKKKIVKSPVKIYAECVNLPLFQPEKIKLDDQKNHRFETRFNHYSSLWTNAIQSFIREC